MVRNFHNGKEIDVSKVVIREKDAPQLYRLLEEIGRGKDEKANEEKG